MSCYPFRSYTTAVRRRRNKSEAPWARTTNPRESLNYTQPLYSSDDPPRPPLSLSVTPGSTLNLRKPSTNPRPQVSTRIRDRSPPPPPKSVEGINPADARAKVPLEVTAGGLVPDWGGVRRGRVMRRVAGRGPTGLRHVLLRLAQASVRYHHLWDKMSVCGTYSVKINAGLESGSTGGYTVGLG